MKINAQTRIKVLLDNDLTGVIDSLVKLNSNFSKLRNPLLRKFFASRINIADACKIGKCSLDDFLNSMQQIGFDIDKDALGPTITKKSAIDFNREATVFELDARAFLDQKKDPLKEILQLANQATIGERLKITNSFEPVPLISLLAEKGFLHQTEMVEKDLIITWFEKVYQKKIVVKLQPEGPRENEPQEFDRVLQQFQPERIKYLDVRELEMPQPMIQILETISTLDDNELLYVLHKKVPVFLLAELDKKDLKAVLNHKSPNELDMLIYRS